MTAGRKARRGLSYQQAISVDENNDVGIMALDMFSLARFSFPCGSHRLP